MNISQTITIHSNNTGCKKSCDILCLVYLDSVVKSEHIVDNLPDVTKVSLQFFMFILQLVKRLEAFRHTLSLKPSGTY